MGKVNREQGANQADRWRKRARKRRRRWQPQFLIAMVIVPLAAFLTVSPSSLETVADLVVPGVATGGAMTGSGSCDIKGNISVNTGERIYHIPGQEHYWETKISPRYGERWFCSEAEAVAAGWRKARR
ncbi:MULTISPECIES: hypothetical protein [Mesorhizobium]|uniref:Succinoglycan biosynthesis protein exoI n=1 Tax=Mesorhizobium amorphae CCNWGS0123 TaxID=1082933 RepID=G6YFW4_9HYPH|nr:MULTISPECIES: hypothetical protein [Mesorhizobium]ANT54355.1 hypothetical protein A6B35_30355 [Mesorhizobium amorphae CCNWGS0123]EHH09358.1 hypothetical protein MEA186_24342 [Mesorhizobium amorphae CCNWGS0123]MCV3211816.1 hypothetical protein [Mesorhizobium sp. YC-2]MCV3233540.1 hypothetical protein [Mesorhizobium sp. YC-39]